MPTRLTWKQLSSPGWLFFGEEGQFEHNVSKESLRPKDDDVFLLFDADDGDKVYPGKRKVPAKGIAVFNDSDQELTAVFKDGKPVFATAWSRRGSVFFHGIYVHDGGCYYQYQNNAYQEGEGPESEAAKRFLLGTKE
jgi:hypothetical protein